MPGKARQKYLVRNNKPNLLTRFFQKLFLTSNITVIYIAAIDIIAATPNPLSAPSKAQELVLLLFQRSDVLEHLPLWRCLTLLKVWDTSVPYYCIKNIAPGLLRETRVGTEHR